MSPKSERFEMRLDADLVERVDDWRMRQSHRPSRSEAIRRLVESGLNSGSSKDFRLSKQEMLTTWLLSEILKNQMTPPSKGKHDLEQVELIQEVVFGGHFWALPWEMSGVIHDHADDPSVVRQVLDILDMWVFTEEAYANFSSADKLRIAAEVPYIGKDPKFMGFDGNNESEHMGVARFLVDKLNRFQHFKGRDFNSHMPTVARYLDMANQFASYRTSLVGKNLDADQVISLLKRN